MHTTALLLLHVLGQDGFVRIAEAHRALVLPHRTTVPTDEMVPA